MNLTELAHNGDTIAIDHGNGQWIPQHSLFFNDISPRVDGRLALRGEPRAIAQPLFALVPTNPESSDYLWGAVGIQVLGDDDSPSIDFERVFDPATEPPVVQMVIHTDAGNSITVDAEQGSPYVTVLDVQREIIRWMKEMRTRSGIDDLTGQFSRWVRMVDDDGAEIEVEVWVWKGLRPLSMDLINWHLHLCGV
jgi:hypothetical protein